MPELQDPIASSELEDRIVSALPADRFEILRRDELRFLDRQQVELFQLGLAALVSQACIFVAAFACILVGKLYSLPRGLGLPLLGVALLAEAVTLSSAAFRIKEVSLTLQRRRVRLAVLRADGGLEEEPTAVHPHLAPCAEAI